MLDFINKSLKLEGEPKFRVVSLFSGCGGSSLGYLWSGGKVLAAVEWDDNAVATYRLNFPDTPVLHRDITTVTTEEMLEITGLHPGELDILDGSPPCQGFSTTGKRQFDDPRNSLFREFVRLLRGLQPKVFVMENVSGMVKGHMKHVFAIIMRELKASGYQVKCQLMNAMYFGVPQSRQRVIFIGIRNDLGIEPGHPKAQTKPITLKEACGDIAYLVLGSHGQYDGRIDNASIEPSPTLCKSGLPSYKHRVFELGKNPPTPSQLKTKRWAETPRGSNHRERFSLSRLSWNEPSPTVQKTATGSTGAMHPDEPRELYEGELKRIGSFPDAFQFAGKWEDVLARIGNSVPPKFMQAIASHIYTHILARLEDIPSCRNASGGTTAW